jgi:hypothetical protein
VQPRALCAQDHCYWRVVDLSARLQGLADSQAGCSGHALTTAARQAARLRLSLSEYATLDTTTSTTTTRTAADTSTTPLSPPSTRPLPRCGCPLHLRPLAGRPRPLSPRPARLSATCACLCLPTTPTGAERATTTTTPSSSPSSVRSCSSTVPHAGCPRPVAVSSALRRREGPGRADERDDGP